jgi:hypothetical protein
VVAGCVVGYAVGRWHAKSVGLDLQVFRSFTLWVLAPAFPLAHWTSLFLSPARDAPSKAQQGSATYGVRYYRAASV